MERGSDKHSARMDDALEAEVHGMMTAGRETRGEDWNSAEPSGEDQPDVDRSPGSTMTGGLADGLTERDLEGRSELAGYLGKEVWPATGQQLLGVAQGRQAPDVLLELLAQLPEGRSFVNMSEVWTTLSGGHEEHRF